MKKNIEMTYCTFFICVIGNTYCAKVSLALRVRLSISCKLVSQQRYDAHIYLFPSRYIRTTRISIKLPDAESGHC